MWIKIKSSGTPTLYDVMGYSLSAKVLAYSTSDGQVMATLWVSSNGVHVWRNAETGKRMDDVTDWQLVKDPI